LDRAARLAPWRRQQVAMEPVEPKLSAHNAEEEPWRLRRLIRTDGRARELLRMVTLPAADSESSVGELVWAHNVLRLHDERGTLQLHVSSDLPAGPWLGLIAMVALRAWDSEDESSIAFFVDGAEIEWPSEILQSPPG
jgi:hypothetical protein